MTVAASAAPSMDGSANEKSLPANTARNFRVGDYARAANDWYVEPRWCVEQLADAVDFSDDVVFDPCCGGGTIPSVFDGRCRGTIASDVCDRGYAPAARMDFLSECAPVPFRSGISIVMNPPFNLAEKFVRHALVVADRRVAVLQQLSFLASKGRYALFTEFPPSDVLILSCRPSMPPGHMIAEMGDKAFKGGTTDFCWIVWTKPHDRETRTRWLSPTDRDPHRVSGRTGNARADVGSENGDDGPGDQRDFRTHEQLPFAPRAAKTLGSLTSSNGGAR